MTESKRTFIDEPGNRNGGTPILIGLVGPSGSGKTYSALRLATGIQSVVGGDIFVIDTEARRSLHYADKFNFRFLQFDPPFGPLDYLAAIRHCVSKGAKTIVVDSMSHEHEGKGGVQHPLDGRQDPSDCVGIGLTRGLARECRRQSHVGCGGERENDRVERDHTIGIDPQITNVKRNENQAGKDRVRTAEIVRRNIAPNRHAAQPSGSCQRPTAASSVLT